MSEREEFDLLIVGAGPAGSFAAERLARAGARVALFDGRAPDDPKACGGGVTSKALKAWPHLLEAAGRTVEEVEMFSPEGARVLLKLDEPFAIYSRTAFDSHLRERARAAGAQIFDERVSAVFERAPGDAWTVRTRGRVKSWRGRVLVAADGANSAVARRLAGPLANAEMEVAFGYRAPLPKGADAPTVIAFLPGWVGYAWAFPRLDHLSFGIATPHVGLEHKPLDEILWHFMLVYYLRCRGERVSIWSPETEKQCDEKAHPAVWEMLRSSVERYAARIPHLSPETWNTRRTAGKDWALIGDAAGFVDPVTDEGIYYAMRSAEIFAGAYLAGNLPAYEKNWHSDFGTNLRRASEMRRRFYGSLLGKPFTDRMIKLASVHYGVRQTLCELVTGQQTYTELKTALVKRALKPFSKTR